MISRLSRTLNFFLNVLQHLYECTHVCYSSMLLMQPKEGTLPQSLSIMYDLASVFTSFACQAILIQNRYHNLISSLSYAIKVGFDSDSHSFFI